MKTFREYHRQREEIGECLLLISQDNAINEAADSTRYSVEVNYRTNPSEVLDAFAKIALGYVSAGIKQHNFHVKHVFSDKPVRILVSSRNWDDGEWVVVVSWNEKDKEFLLSKGFYNKDRKTVSVQKTEKGKDTAAELAKQVYNMMHSLKGEKDRHQEKLKPVPLKRGPKK